MRIDHLELTNFKNFSQLTVDFKPGINLLVGSNGSGKTSLLEGINIAAGGFFASQGPKLQRTVNEQEVKLTNGVREEYVRIIASCTAPAIRWSKKRGQKTTVKVNLQTGDTKDANFPDIGLDAIRDYGAAYFIAFNIADDRTVAPLIAYYSTQRLFSDAAQSKKQKYDVAAGRKNGYLQCLDENAIKPVLDEWLGNGVTRRATKQIKEIDAKDQVLENVEEAIKKTLIEFLDLPADFPLKMYQDPDHNNELFLNYDAEHDLPLSYYSDGFRNLIYLIIDMVWRASQLNPWLTLSDIKAQVTGVVTIDEIDLHLHPKWQSKAVGLIQLLFPNVQFFITTHSPTIVANFNARPNDALFVIENNSVNQVHEKFFGKQVNNILSNILDAPYRHVPTQKKIDDLLRKIDDLAPDTEIVPLLESLANMLGEDDPDVVKARSLLEWNHIKNADINAIH